MLGRDAYWDIPSLFWWSSSDSMLFGACVAGAFLSALIAVGICPGGCALLCWGLYLSLCRVSSPFLDFQWDTLLLETALLAAIYLPWRIRPRWNAESGLARLGRWLLWWLLFRLMFESGVVKLTSGDSTWHDLTALSYHYETQPLPFWPAWYASQSPLWLLKVETLLMFAAELIAPFLIIAPRRFRHGGALAMIALQIGIMATGNYAFFNWLTILLCLTLFDHTFWPASWRRRSGRFRGASHARGAAVGALDLPSLCHDHRPLHLDASARQFPSWLSSGRSPSSAFSGRSAVSIPTGFFA